MQGLEEIRLQGLGLGIDACPSCQKPQEFELSSRQRQRFPVNYGFLPGFIDQQATDSALDVVVHVTSTEYRRNADSAAILVS